MIIIEHLLAGREKDLILGLAQKADTKRDQEQDQKRGIKTVIENFTVEIQAIGGLIVGNGDQGEQEAGGQAEKNEGATVLIEGVEEKIAENGKKAAGSLVASTMTLLLVAIERAAVEIKTRETTEHLSKSEMKVSEEAALEVTRR